MSKIKIVKTETHKGNGRQSSESHMLLAAITLYNILLEASIAIKAE